MPDPWPRDRRARFVPSTRGSSTRRGFPPLRPWLARTGRRACTNPMASIARGSRNWSDSRRAATTALGGRNWSRALPRQHSGGAGPPAHPVSSRISTRIVFEPESALARGSLWRGPGRPRTNRWGAWRAGLDARLPPDRARPRLVFEKSAQAGSVRRRSKRGRTSCYSGARGSAERSHSGLVQRFAKPPSGVTCFEGSNPSLSAIPALRP